MAVYHERRTVEWGNWGIDFMDENPNLDQNYGKIVGHINFPVSTRGPMDNMPDQKAKYKAMCDAWIKDRTIPEGLVEEK